MTSPKKDETSLKLRYSDYEASLSLIFLILSE